ncbi:MAG TPA: acyl-CoA dehydrogenase family protein [Candidatus Binatia bacterium]|jgi:alkylation response protein AidB-like acyl-CoA dehydrogenase
MAQPKDFGFGSEEQMVRDSARKLLKDAAGIETLRALVARDHKAAYESAVQPAPWDERLWTQMIELGWTALAVPEDAGGAGMKMVAVAALAEEIGRVAVPSPLVSTLVATMVLRAAAERAAAAAAGSGPRLQDPPAAPAWLERIAAGTPATIALTPPSGSWDPADTAVRAERNGSSIVLRGEAAFVQDARKAAFFVVAASGEGGVGLYAVAADTPGLTIRPDRIADLTRDQARLAFDDVRIDTSSIVAAPGSGTEVVEAAMPAMLTIVAADLCGAAEWQLQTTTEYARVRTQFDHPIGFFQAVKHPIVNMMMDVDRARSLVYAAACAIDTDPGEAPRLARMAKAAASDAAAFCSDRSIQLHGGIGFTWECDVHLYVKRQKHNQFLYGDGSYQRARLAALIDGEAGGPARA